MWYLYIDNTFASFEQLSQKFGLTGIHSFRYLQIRDFVRKSFVNFPLIPKLNCLDTLLFVNTAKKGRVSMIYNEIMNSCYPTTQHVRRHWEDELGAPLSNEEWDMALSRVHSSSTCARHALIQFKIIHRLHLSKAKLAKIFPNINPLCDRSKQAPATTLHMFWSCSTLDNFWSNIFDTISRAYNINIAPSAKAAVFGILPNGFPAHIQRVVAFTSLLARRLILFQWKDATPPSHNQWIITVMQNIKVEKIGNTISGITGRFHKTWDPFLNVVNNLPGLEP